MLFSPGAMNECVCVFARRVVKQWDGRDLDLYPCARVPAWASGVGICAAGARAQLKGRLDKLPGGHGSRPLI